MANASSNAAAAVKAKTAAAKVLRQKNNENTAKFLALGVAGIMILFVIFHWTHIFYNRYGTRQTRSSSVLRFPTAVTRSGLWSRLLISNDTYMWNRISRSLLIQKVPGFISAGHALVVWAT